MGFGDILILLLVAAAAIAALCFLHRHKGVASGCSGNCAACQKRCSTSKKDAQ